MRPAKAGASSGRQSHRGKSRSLVAWVAGLQWETGDSEAYRQRHRKDGGESPGRSASEREVASKLWPRRPAGNGCGEGSMAHREQTDAMGHSGGVVIDGMVTRTC